ncbi:MAG TPA: phenylalanine--tRNA ligase subunit alpha [Elusimicrobia bacterium]|nr:phenylalanine--tRNA ligase subunit alpha [Elusimicrobiota bacterium]
MNASEWKEKLSRVGESFSSAISGAAAGNIAEVELQFLGRKGELALLLRDLGSFTIEEKKELGRLGNELKARLVAALEAREAELGAGRAKAAAGLDLTLSGRPFPKGSLHPITQAMDRITVSLMKLGFSVAEGPHVEEDHYNFEALNFPADHPARDMQDTFYAGVKDASGKDMLLRTHTSPVQIRSMKGAQLPLRIISPGRVFRSEAVDASHSFVFHQMEGLYVDKAVSMADLRWTLDAFIKDLFGSAAKVRFAPSYFPFVEPGAQVEVSCVFCGGKADKCPVCKSTGWLEMLGAGMVHPNVLKACGHDPEKWSGFAFGAGVERFAMLLFGIKDMRMFYENDLRVWKQL